MGDAVWILGGYQSDFPWPSMFAQVTDQYDRRYGLDDACAPQPQRAWTVPDPIRGSTATTVGFVVTTTHGT